MTGLQRVIGIDPGPTPGVVYLEYAGPVLDRVEIIQCTHGFLFNVLDQLLEEAITPVLVGVEMFVARGRLSADQQLTEAQVTRVRSAVYEHQRGYPNRTAQVVDRPAVAVKAWATDVRLHASGLADLTKGMRHSRDAARHALFAAVRDCGIPDPLSRKARA